MPVYSLDVYKGILRLMLEQGRRVAPLSAHGNPSTGGPDMVYLRHDIDYSLEIAVEMAEANADLDLAGCFCIQVRNPLYNLADEYNLRAVERLRALGQTVGLHFALFKDEFENSAPAQDQIGRWIAADHRLLRAVLGDACTDVVSWHNPSVLCDGYADLVGSDYKGVLNANALGRSGVQYISDANHRYLPAAWREMIVSSEAAIQALFHPFQWVVGGDGMEETLARTWQYLVRQYERVFLTNHVYRARLPKGLPDASLEALTKPLLGVNGRDG